MIGVIKKPRENSGSPELRMWLLVRLDLRMPLGKFAAQAGHGYTTGLWLSSQRDPVLVETYMRHSQAKIAVGVRHEQELLACIAECEEAGLIAVAIKDAGRTVFERPTVTVGAVGPCYRKDLPKRVRRLRLFDTWQAQAD